MQYSIRKQPHNPKIQPHIKKQYKSKNKKKSPQMKSRKQFSLQNPDFNSQSSAEEDTIPSQLITMYNKEYSMIVSETKNFFADCKEILSRFITFNSFGIGFNLPLMLATVIRVEGQVGAKGSGGGDRDRDREGSWQDRKARFQDNFVGILEKMGDVIEELLNFQVKIKSVYLGQAFTSPTKMKTRFTVPVPKNLKPRNSSISTKFPTNQNQKQQQLLRNIFQKGMKPSQEIQQQVCTLKSTPSENINKLSKKIDSLKQQVEGARAREQKIWEIFNEKRPSRGLGGDEGLGQSEICVDMDMGMGRNRDDEEKDKQFHKLNQMLCDLVSQKNMSYCASPYETVESSFRI